MRLEPGQLYEHTRAGAITWNDGAVGPFLLLQHIREDVWSALDVERCVVIRLTPASSPLYRRIA